MDRTSPLTQRMKDLIQKATKMNFSTQDIQSWLSHEFPNTVLNAHQFNNFLAQCRKAVKAPHLDEATQLTMYLLKTSASKKNPHRLWFRHAVDQHNRLKTLFWMSAEQRVLYNRYRDIVIHDTTASTNRFHMSLHCFVVVDSEFKTRIVACALTAGETTRDYEWVLGRLLLASGNIAPEAIMIDKDPAMDAACASIIPQTRVMNCVWHASKNRYLRLHSPLRDTWRSFEGIFIETCRSLTPPEFDSRWSALCERFGDDGGAIDRYLQRLYDDRHQWGWPWVRTQFTAGIQSTQRVEKTHHLVKMMPVDNSASLKSVVAATVDVSTKEYFRAKFTKDAEGKKMRAEIASWATFGATSVMFRDVLSLCKEVLSCQARERMKREMDWSFMLTHSISDLVVAKQSCATSEKVSITKPIRNNLHVSCHNEASYRSYLLIRLMIRPTLEDPPLKGYWQSSIQRRFAQSIASWTV